MKEIREMEIQSLDAPIAFLDHPFDHLKHQITSIQDHSSPFPVAPASPLSPVGPYLAGPTSNSLSPLCHQSSPFLPTSSPADDPPASRVLS